MRASVLFLALSVLLPFRAAGAQERASPPAPPALAAVLPVPEALAPAVDVSGRDRGRGALYGGAIGALVGGVGFAAANYAFTKSSPRSEYTLPSLVLGGLVGGAAGALVGAVVGAPERDGDRPRQVRLHLVPPPIRGGTASLSVSLPSR